MGGGGGKEGGAGYCRLPCLSLSFGFEGVIFGFEGVIFGFEFEFEGYG